jgi:hypothetical protein
VTRNVKNALSPVVSFCQTETAKAELPRKRQTHTMKWVLPPKKL